MRDRLAAPPATIVLLVLAAGTAPLQAQAPLETIHRERADFASWLATAPLSPFAAIALQPIGQGLSIGGTTSDIPLTGLSGGTVAEEGGLAVLTLGGRRLALPRGRPVPVPPYTLLASGPRGRGVLAVFGPHRSFREPAYFPHQDLLVATARLEPPERRGGFTVLGLDGLETQATEAGFFPVTVGAAPTRLRAYLLGDPDDDEAGIYIFFQDSTNGRGSYPGGRFVELLPAEEGRYRLDFNRARNPFCAYSTVFPCPAPWPGNRLSAPVRAGEQYHDSTGGG